MKELRLKIAFFAGPTLLLILLTTVKATAQLTIGLSGGFHVPGAQDQKFKHYNSNGALQDIIYSSQVDAKSTTFNSAHATLWRKDKNDKELGFKFEVISWNFVSTVDETLSDKEIPFDQITQERLAVFISALKKVYTNNESVHYFAGIGGGLVLTDVDPGNYEWKHGLQLTAGLFRQVNPNLEWIIECKYILTYDADNTGQVAGWVVDTSGTPAPFRLGPHLDTRFLTIQFGLQWRIL